MSGLCSKSVRHSRDISSLQIKHEELLLTIVRKTCRRGCKERRQEGRLQKVYFKKRIYEAKKSREIEKEADGSIKVQKNDRERDSRMEKGLTKIKVPSNTVHLS